MDSVSAGITHGFGHFIRLGAQHVEVVTDEAHLNRRFDGRTLFELLPFA